MFTRNEQNPILTAEDLGFAANSVFNPGAVLMEDGSVALLLRVEDRSGRSSIHVGVSPDGRRDFKIDPQPLLYPRPQEHWCEWGFEDARVSWVAELERYVITCTAYGPPGPCVFMATSVDLHSVERGEVIMSPEDKNAALFPRRVDGSWLLLHRPVVMASNSADVWVSHSDEDIFSWRAHEQVLTRRPNGWWDSARVGIGPPPIETDRGWLQLYHGVRNTMSGAIYRMGAALLDLDRPWLVRRRLDDWLLSPEAPWERVGDVGNVVFPCGAIRRGDQLDVYYGGADSVVCLATGSVDQLLDALEAGAGSVEHSL